MPAGGLLWFRNVSTIVQIAAFSGISTPTPTPIWAPGHLIAEPRVSRSILHG